MAGIVLAPPLQLGQPGFNWISGTWTWTHLGTGPPYILVRVARSFLGWHTAVGLAVAGVLMLTGYCLARRRQRHRGSSHGPLAGFFPVVAVGFFGVVALALLGLRLSGLTPYGNPVFVIATFGVLITGYAVRVGQAFLRP